MFDIKTGKAVQFNVNNIAKIPEFMYLCERNAIRVLLEGSGVGNPLLLMQNGVFLKDVAFLEKGIFSTAFRRSILPDSFSDFIASPVYRLEWGIIQEQLGHGLPVMIYVDVYYMKYKTFYQKNHAGHYVLIIGCCENKYQIFDWYEPDYFMGYISEQELELARISENPVDGTSAFSGVPIRAEYRLLNYERLKYCGEINHRDFIIKNLCKIFFSFIEENDPTKGLSFIEKFGNTPRFVENYDNSSYVNAMQSFFFLELELNIFIRYIDEIISNGLFRADLFDPLKELSINLRKNTIAIKNKCHMSYRRSKGMPVEEWMEISKSISEDLHMFPQKIYDILTFIKCQKVGEA